VTDATRVRPTVLVVDDEPDVADTYALFLSDDRLDDFFGMVSKLSVLREGMTQAELRDSEEYQQLRREAEQLGDELGETVEDFEEIVETYREINRGS
jgi:hypothetical protein